MISVIVPYRDAEKYIARCADSLAMQTGDFEFIFVNDHSTDGGSHILSRYDDRFVVMDNQRHDGVSGARNTGLSVAHGEWIAFLDVDDEFLPDAYRKLIRTIAQDKDADIHQVSHRRHYAKTGATTIRYACQEGKYKMPYPPDVWFGVWNKLFRAEFVKDIRFDEELQYGEDGMFVLECFAKGAYIHHGNWNVTVAQHNIENMESLSHIKKGTDVLKQVRRYLDFLDRQQDPTLRMFMCEEMVRLFSNPRLQELISHV